MLTPWNILRMQKGMKKLHHVPNLIDRKVLDNTYSRATKFFMVKCIKIIIGTNLISQLVVLASLFHAKH